VSSKFEAMPLSEMSFYREKIRSKEIPLELIEQKIRKFDSGDHHQKIMGHIMDEWSILET
jgi:hypothetical protein